MKAGLFDPYDLKITDPLFELANRRRKVIETIESGTIAPIYLMIYGIEKLIFNGNKRTVVSRELFRYISAKIIESEEDLFDAQKEDPRFFPVEMAFNYQSVLMHLLERANQYSALNYRTCPVQIGVANRIMQSRRQL